MKNTIKLLGIIAFAVIIGFTMAACSSGGSGGDALVETTYSTNYKWASGSDQYELVITEDGARKMVTNGSYVLTATVGGATTTSYGRALGSLTNMTLIASGGSSITLSITTGANNSINVSVSSGTTLGSITIKGGSGTSTEITITGGGTNWDGNYETWDSASAVPFITTVNTKAGTIKGAYIRDASFTFVWDANYIISNVTFGNNNNFPSSSDVNNEHSGQWAYVYSGNDKIGIVYSHIMKVKTNGTVAYESYKLLLGDTDKNIMNLWTPSDGSSPQAVVVLTDVVNKGFLVDAFFDK